MGRDWFDLFWFLSRTPPVKPNLTLLKKALLQTNPEQSEKIHQWRELILAKLETIDWDQVVKDVQPLIERRSDLVIFTKENVLSVLDK